MKSTIFTSTNFKAALVVIALFMGGCKDNFENVSDSVEANALATIESADDKNAITAQSIMIDLSDVEEEYVLGGERYEFDEVTAAIAEHGYDNCTGTPEEIEACQNKAKQAAKKDRCEYWNDGKRFWNLVSGGSEIKIDLTLAAQSFVINNTVHTRGKFSFDLESEDGSRITDLEYSLDGINFMPLAHTIEKGEDFDYTASEGLTFGRGQDYLLNGSVREILEKDGFDKNDTPEHFVKATAALLFTSLAEGEYTLTIRGNFKGNPGIASRNFKVKKGAGANVTPGCNQNKTGQNPSSSPQQGGGQTNTQPVKGKK